MRLFLVLFSILVALGLWVWATGPGTTLPLAVGAGSSAPWSGASPMFC
ncbi:hypothetical protein ACFQU7_03310 [Pseudoroseomonas wenyumeiae]